MQKILKISQQTFWQLIVKLATAVSGFIIIGLISRTYGQSGVGDFTLALTYLTFFYTLSDFGFNAHILSRIQKSDIRGQIEWRKLLGVRILWSLLLTLVALAILIFLPVSFSADFKLATVFGSLIILLFALNLTSAAIFQAKLRYDLDIVPTLIGVLASVGLTYLLVSFGLPIYLVILSYLVAWFIHALGTLLASLRFIKSLLPIFDLNYLKDLFRSTWPLAGTLVLNIIYFRADSFILANHFGSAQVGIYNIAYQVFQTILVLPTFIMNAFYPMMLETMRLQVTGYRLQVKTAATGLFFAAILFATVVYALSPAVISLITGSGFEGSVTSLRILSFGFPAYFLSALLMWVYISKNMYKKMLLVYGLGLAFNLVANWIFIPQYSYIAASWITGISEYLILMLQIMVLWRR